MPSVSISSAPIEPLRRLVTARRGAVRPERAIPSPPRNVPDVAGGVAPHQGLARRRTWSAHPVLKVDFSQSNIDIEDYLPRKLKAFSMPTPSLLTKFKKHFIYARPVTSLLKKYLSDNVVPQEPLAQVDITQALKTSTPALPNVYNVVLTSTHMVVGKLGVLAPKLRWLLSKHVLLASYSDDVRFAGEVWKDERGRVHFNARSGTYTPSRQDLENMLRLARRMFPKAALQADHLFEH